MIRTLARVALAAFLAAAGLGHLVAPEEFLAQTPTWLPWRPTLVFVSGLVELVLAGALLAWRHRRVAVGWVVAGFFVLVFPGNVHQAVTATPAFGLETDLARWTRLAVQPLLVAWALYATGAWRAWRRRHTRRPGGRRPTAPGR